MDTDIETGVFLRYKFEMNFIRIISDYIGPCNAKFICDLYLEPGISQYDSKVQKAFDKMKGWIALKENAIIHNRDSVLGNHIMSYRKINNHSIVLPCEPVDDIICMVLMKKFNAICNGLIDITGVTIETNDSDGIETAVVGDADGYMPSMKEWSPESKDTSPWWDRGDASSDDFSIPSDDSSSYLTVPEPNIIRPLFKPRIIKGDLDI